MYLCVALILVVSLINFNSKASNKPIQNQHHKTILTARLLHHKLHISSVKLKA